MRKAAILFTPVSGDATFISALLFFKPKAQKIEL
jgi:hypothetical protein